MFAQVDNESLRKFEFNSYAPDAGNSWLYEGLWSVLWIAYFALWIWMLVECLRKDPDRLFWFWIIFFIQPPGPIIYFFLRWLPSNDLRLPKSMRRWGSGKEINRLQAAALQIGNAHQFIQLADALREAGQFDRAGNAYAEALNKEPENIRAMWGAALVDIERGKFEPACDRLRRVLELDPQYKFGDVSLAYGRALYKLQNIDRAQEHFEKHVKRWRHPEGVFLLATIHAERGNSQEARSHLQAMLLDINSSPQAIARKYGIWKIRARKLLKKLPRHETRN